VIYRPLPRTGSRANRPAARSSHRGSHGAAAEEKESKVHTRRPLAIVTAIVSLAVPATASAQGQDLRNPDRQSPATPTQTQDLRNPDQQAPTAPEPTQDLRNADRRAPGTGAVTAVEAPAVTTIELPAAGGFDWGSAGIGAAGGIALLGLLAGLAMAATHRRRSGTRVIA
jgi:hypothetical protein